MNHLLVNGENSIEVIVAHGESPSRVRDGGVKRDASGISVELEVGLYQPETIPGDDPAKNLAKMRWVGGGEETFPLPLTAKFDVVSPFAPWAWERAPVLTLDGPTVTEAVAVVRALHAVFERKDFNAISRVKERGTREAALAYGEDWAENEAAAARALDETWNAPGWAMEPLVAEDFDLRLVAGGRLIEAIGKNWEPLLRGTEDSEGSRLSFPVLIGRDAGALAVLR